MMERLCTSVCVCVEVSVSVQGFKSASFSTWGTLLWPCSSRTCLRVLARQVVPSLPRHPPACSLPPRLLLRQALIPPSLLPSGSVRCPCWTAALLTPCWSRLPRTSSPPTLTCSELRLPTPPPPSQVRSRVSASTPPAFLPPSHPAYLHDLSLCLHVSYRHRHLNINLMQRIELFKAVGRISLLPLIL